jgi:hypothetical protein
MGDGRETGNPVEPASFGQGRVMPTRQEMGTTSGNSQPQRQE